MPTNDGNVPYGSYIVTVGSTSFVAENLNPSSSTTIIERRNSLSEPSGQVIIPDFESATMTLQRPATATALPARGATALFPAGAGLAGTWYVSEVGASYEQGSDQKFSVTVRKSVA